MIHSLDILDPTSVPISWWDKVPALAKPRKFEFKPGLNVLWGKNGSGKTTVLKLLADLFHCAQSGQPVVTSTSVEEVYKRYRGPSDEKSYENLEKCLAVSHDGQGVRHFDPSHAVGLFGGLAAFDDDFMMQGIQNAMFKGSAGQTTMQRFDRLVREIVEGSTPKVEWRVRKDGEGYWADRNRAVDKFLKRTGENGPPTILLDEPERSLDLPTQVAVWRMLRAHSPDAQFIVASHSFFALDIPEANYIEMDPGYLRTSMRALALLQGWRDDKPQPIPKSVLKQAQSPAKKPAKKPSSGR